MKKYSVKELAKLASISIRTLHYYDKIGLLKPAFRSEKGYRYYGLAQMYVEDERFKAHYDKYRSGLAVFIKAGIGVFCENDLKIILK